jgi:hypothetical protein
MPLFNEVKFPAPVRSTLTGTLKPRASTPTAAGRLLCGIAMVTLLLSGCSQNNPAARKATLEKFCTSVAQHVLDRNPNTISESLSTLLHEELSDAARQKLEDTKVIPDSPITVLREKDIWTKGHKSNRIDVGIVRALTPIEAKDVTFKVSGKDWDLVDGKQTDFHAFQFTMTTELTPDMDGLPRVLEIQGLGAGGSPTAVAAEVKDDSPKSSPKRRRRH